MAPRSHRLARIFRGRLFFTCPACNQPAELYADVAGSDTRCPRCFSAIRAPHPRKRIRARNREQDLDSLLHPERFRVTVPPQNRGCWPFLSFSPTQRGLVAAIASIVFIETAAFAVHLHSVFDIFSKKPASAAPGNAGTEPSPALALYPGSGELRNRAEEVVRKFLAADQWHAKAQFVRHRDRIIPNMMTYYAEHPWESSTGYLTLSSIAPAGSSLAAAAPYPLTDVAVQWDNYEVSIFQVEHLPEGDLIEWESSVGFNAGDWGGITGDGTAGERRGQFRILAAPDDYFNYGYQRSRFLCVRLQDARTNALLGYGYVDRSTADAKEIDFLLRNATRDNPQRLIVDVGFNEDSAKTRQVNIVRLIQSGWRTVAPALAGDPSVADPKPGGGNS